MNNTIHIKSLGSNDTKIKEMVKIASVAKSKNLNHLNHLTGLNEQQIKAVQEVLKRF